MHPPLPAIERSKDGMIGTVWLNRPDAANAYDMPMLRQLRRAINAMECEPDVRVIVIRGRGVNFCTGGHISMLSSGQSWQELPLYAAKTFERVAESRKVTIAAVHGAAIGGGFELMLACDLAIATLDARIGDIHIRNGLYPGAGTTYRLPRLIGARKAKELMLSGDILDGTAAQEWNIINAVAPTDEFETAIARFAARFSDKSPTVAWLTKTAVNRSLDADVQTLMTLEHTTSAVIGASEDAREGLAALRDKRTPNWRPLPPGIEAMFENEDDRGNEDL